MSPRMEYKLLVTRRIRDLVKVTLWKQCRNIIIQPVVFFFFLYRNWTPWTFTRENSWSSSKLKNISNKNGR